MRLIRSVAMKISGVVVRYASPGCKEWAEGLACETEFIEDDWSALRWAMGSTRVLLDRRRAGMASLADVEERARLFSEAISKRSYSTMYLLALALPPFLKLLHARTWQQRIGCGLVIVASIYMGIVGWLQQRGRRARRDTAVGDLTLHYKSELERQRDLLRSGIGRLYLIVVILYFIGVAFAQKGGVRAHPFLTMFSMLVCVLVVLFLLRQPRRVQRQIDEVDAVLKETR
jgi:hypothetical protein